jgi:hypothetical protein
MRALTLMSLAIAAGCGGQGTATPIDASVDQATPLSDRGFVAVDQAPTDSTTFAENTLLGADAASEQSGDLGGGSDQGADQASATDAGTADQAASMDSTALADSAADGPPILADAGAPEGGGVGSSCDPLGSDCMSGLKCQYAPSTATGSCQVDGTVLPDEPCTKTGSVDDCKGGAYCVFGYCSVLCAGDSYCLGAEACTGSPGLGFCLPTCTPGSTGECDPGLSCTNSVDWDGSTVLAVCAKPGSVPTGSACTHSNDCVAGDGCANAGGGSGYLCYVLCDFGGGGSCASGTCNSLAGSATVGFCN